MSLLTAELNKRCH